MLFLVYWELNEKMPLAERIQIAQKLTSPEVFPPEGVNILRWDITADNWGVMIAETENFSDLYRALTTWRAAGAGFFKVSKTSPAMPVAEYMPITAEIVSTLGAT